MVYGIQALREESIIPPQIKADTYLTFYIYSLSIQKKKVFNSLTFRVFTKQKTEGGSVDSLGGGDQKPPLQY